MSFNSLEFLVFFPTVAVLYFVLPYRFRLTLLLIASYVFYMSWNAKYALVLVVMTLLDYAAGLAMGRTADKAKRRKYLAVSLTGNLLLLGVFKYFNFAGETLSQVVTILGYRLPPPSLQLILPLGVSFHTFQTMAYAIDVYRGAIPPERKLIRFATYVVFFPQLIAGPIERAKHFMPQFFERHDFSYARAADGLRRMLWGFFKKVVIADRLAVYVNAVYANPGEHGTAQVIVATYFFAYQIYCDFSGYCDIALGAAEVLGFRLMENFDRPYHARSIRDFWQRWHISLTTWFKDYVCIPLGGNRVSTAIWYRNILIVFALSGLWHGAKWTFVAWGLVHGAYLIAALVTADARQRWWGRLPAIFSATPIRAIVQTVITFQLVCVGWVFFRASSLADVRIIFGKLFEPHWGWQQVSSPFAVAAYNDSGANELMFAVILIALLEVIQTLQKSDPISAVWGRQPVAWRWAGYYAVALTIVALGRFDETQFIYFQF